ncbi:MAG: ABC transporter ATP-binding protein [Gemmatimonadaceae bacterium]
MLSVAVTKTLPGFTLAARWESSADVIALFGASGAGKSLTLQAIAGLVRPDEGRISFGETVYFDRGRGLNLPARRRGIGYVFQGYALFPHLSVADNIAFGLAGQSRGAVRGRVGELIDQLGLRELERLKPSALSGGEQQRVALGRALAPKPSLLLLDEPFSALDAPLRRQLRDEISTILRHQGSTTVIVTHDIGEAFQLADHIVVYEAGRVIQQAPKSDLLARPVSEQVARLLGVRNILAGEVISAAPDRIALRWHGHTLHAANLASRPFLPGPGTHTAFFIRPEHIRLVRKDRPESERTHQMNVLDGTIVGEIDLGLSYAVLFAVDGVAPSGLTRHHLEIDVTKLAYELLGIANDRRWRVAIQPSAVQTI